MDRKIIIACGNKKRDATCRAGDMYIGKSHRRFRLVAKAWGFKEVWILSAKYGLIHENTVISPYSAVMYHKGSIKSKMEYLQANGMWTEGTEFIKAQSHLPEVLDIMSLYPKTTRWSLVTSSYRYALPDTVEHKLPIMGIGKVNRWADCQIAGIEYRDRKEVSDEELRRLTPKGGWRSISVALKSIRGQDIGVSSKRLLRLGLINNKPTLF